MNGGLAIGLAELSPETQRRVDRDAWLLAAWWLVVGLTATVLLHRIAGVRSPLWRYPLTAALMYALGDVLALRAWLSLFARSVRAAPHRWRVAVDDERASGRSSVSRLTLAFAAVLAAVVGVAVTALKLLGAVYGVVVAVALVVALAVLAIVALATQRLPAVLAKPVLMAELALDFVFGRAVGRNFLPPRPRRESLATIVRETWPRGVSLLVLAVVAAATLVAVAPGAESRMDAFR